MKTYDFINAINTVIVSLISSVVAPLLLRWHRDYRRNRQLRAETNVRWEFEYQRLADYVDGLELEIARVVNNCKENESIDISHIEDLDIEMRKRPKPSKGIL